MVFPETGLSWTILPFWGGLGSAQFTAAGRGGRQWSQTNPKLNWQNSMSTSFSIAPVCLHVQSKQQIKLLNHWISAIYLACTHFSQHVFWSWMWGVYWCPDYLCTEVGRGSRCHRLSNGSHWLRSWHTCRTTQQHIFSSITLDLNRVSTTFLVTFYPSSHVKLRTLLIGASVLPMANGRRGTGIGHDVAEREDGTIIGDLWLQNTMETTHQWKKRLPAI